MDIASAALALACLALVHALGEKGPSGKRFVREIGNFLGIGAIDFVIIVFKDALEFLRGRDNVHWTYTFSLKPRHSTDVALAPTLVDGWAFRSVYLIACKCTPATVRAQQRERGCS